MAQYRCSVKPRLSRGKGASVARAASYIVRERIDDERTGETFDFSHHKDRALWSGVFVPNHAPEWARDLQTLVTEIERAEKRKDAQLVLPIELSLAHELTPEQNRWMLQDFIKENFTRQGYATIAAIHEPPSHGDERNIHAHLLVTLRKLDEDGFSKTKHEQQQNFLARSERVEVMRQSWEKHLKHHLERHGFEREAGEVSCKSLEAQGIDREPTQHLGPVAAHMERAGEQSELGDLNREIEARNQELERLKAEERALAHDLEEADKVARQTLREREAERLSNFLRWSASGEEFQRLAERRGFRIAQNDRAGVVALDAAGNVYSFHKDHAEKLADIDKEALPTVEQAKELQQERQDEERRKAAASLVKAYERGADMVSQQQAANRHHEQRQKDLEEAEAIKQREAEEEKPRQDEEQRQAAAEKTAHEDHARRQEELRQQEERKRQEQEAAKKKEREEAAKRQREQEERQREEQRQREQGGGFAGRQDHGQQKQQEQAARQEQTEARRREQQKNIMQELFERRFGKGHNENTRENWERERER